MGSLGNWCVQNTRLPRFHAIFHSPTFIFFYPQVKVTPHLCQIVGDFTVYLRQLVWSSVCSDGCQSDHFQCLRHYYQEQKNHPELYAYSHCAYTVLVPIYAPGGAAFSKKGSKNLHFPKRAHLDHVTLSEKIVIFTT